VPRLPRSGSLDGSRNEEAADGPYAVDEAFEEERALAWSRAARVAFQDHLETEGTDGRWTADREGALRSVLVSAALGGPDVLQVDCRTTLCGIRLRFRDTTSREQFFARFRSAPVAAGMGPFFMVCDGWEDTEVEVYVAREGYGLPAL
jgi:hypothetical protein